MPFGLDGRQPGLCFVIEVMVPELRRLSPGETFHGFGASDTHFGIDDVANQELVPHHLTFVEGRLDRVSMPFRYIWPAEVDPMAELVGMRLR